MASAAAALLRPQVSQAASAARPSDFKLFASSRRLRVAFAALRGVAENSVSRPGAGRAGRAGLWAGIMNGNRYCPNHQSERRVIMYLAWCKHSCKSL